MGGMFQFTAMLIGVYKACRSPQERDHMLHSAEANNSKATEGAQLSRTDQGCNV
jgi:hypothetical protein